MTAEAKEGNEEGKRDGEVTPGTARAGQRHARRQGDRDQQRGKEAQRIPRVEKSDRNRRAARHPESRATPPKSHRALRSRCAMDTPPVRGLLAGRAKPSGGKARRTVPVWAPRCAKAPRQSRQGQRARSRRRATPYRK